MYDKPPAIEAPAPHDQYVRGANGLYTKREAGWWPWIPVQPALPFTKPWTPASLPNLIGWWDASDLTTLFQNSALSTAVTTDSQPVGGWKDKSTTAAHVIQATSATRPTYRNVGGLSWVDFASGNYIAKTGVYGSGITAVSSIIGFYLDHTSNNNAGVVTNTADQATNDDYYWGVQFVSGTGPYFAGWDPTTSAGNGSADSTHFWIDTVQTNAITPDGTHVYSNTSSGIAKTHSLPNGIQFGWDRSLTGRFLVGRIYALIICSSVLSDSDRALAELWMRGKCGINF